MYTMLVATHNVHSYLLSNFVWHKVFQLKVSFSHRTYLMIDFLQIPTYHDTIGYLHKFIFVLVGAASWNGHNIYLYVVPYLRMCGQWF